jgi:voltage-gated potassium channel
MKHSDDLKFEERRKGPRRNKENRIPSPNNSVGRRASDILNAAAPSDITSQDESAITNNSLRSRLYRLLAVGGNDKASKYFDIFIITLIALNVVAVIIGSVKSIELNYSYELRVFEIISVLIFTVEYLLRVWTSIEAPKRARHHPVKSRLRYMMTPMAIIDLLAVAPFYLTIFFSVDLRFMRVLRLLRIFKLTRYSPAMAVVLTVLKKESQAFGATLFVFVLLMIFSASIIYLFEHKAQPEVFTDIPQAMWWAVITLTTIGYGDAYPITDMGRLVGAGISILSIGLVALPAGILASGFSEQLYIRRQKYQDRVQDALEDGVLTYDEAENLKAMQKELGISGEEARSLVKNILSCSHFNVSDCPHCGKPIKAKHKT